MESVGLYLEVRARSCGKGRTTPRIRTSRHLAVVIAGVAELLATESDASERSTSDRLATGRGAAVVSAIRIAKQELRPFFTPKGLAAYLSISERTVRDMLSKQRIASYKVEG